MDNFADDPGTTASICAEVAASSGVRSNWRQSIGSAKIPPTANLINFRAEGTTRQKKKNDIGVEAWVVEHSIGRDACCFS